MKAARAVFTSFLLVIIGSLLTVVSLAQTSRGRISGTVTDPQGAIVAGARVVARNTQTSVAQETVTTGEGLYILPELTAGTYDVSVTAQGFKEAVNSGVGVETNRTLSIDFRLETGAVSETVTVTADVTPIQRDSPQVITTVTRKQVVELPLEVGGTVAGRSAEAFTTLAPGVSGSLFLSRIGGGQNFSNEVLLDGASIARTENQASFDETAPSPNAYQEFSIQTSSYSAEFGRTGGGVTSFTLKSGTNDFHGEVYYFLRNRALNANNFFNNARGRDPQTGEERIARPIDSQNDFGFNVGGPIYLPRFGEGGPALLSGKNRSFFFFNYEGYRFTQTQSGLTTIPTLKMRQGDFSELLDPNQVGNFGGTRQIYNPFDTSCGGPRCPFPGNIIPPSLQSAVARNILALFPQPTFTDRVVNNYIYTTPLPLTMNTWTIKLDHSLSERHKITGSYSNRVNERTAGGGTFLPEPLEGPDPWHQIFATRYFRFSDDYTFGPTLLNHFNFGFNRTESGNTPFTTSGVIQAIGLKGVPTDQTNTAFPRMSFINERSFGYAGVGQFRFDQLNNNSFTFADTVNYIAGKHTLRFGGDFRRWQFNPRRNGLEQGEINFHSRFTSPGDGPFDASGGDPIASLYIGAVEFAQRNVFTTTAGWRQNYLAFFLQDDYKVSQRLTLNLGVRYDLQPARTEVLDRYRIFVPTASNPEAGGRPGAIVNAGTNGVPRGFIETDKGEFSPRLGFAYSLNDKTVIRGGYGIYYSPFLYNDFGGAGLIGFNPNRQFFEIDQPVFRLDEGFPAIIPEPTTQNVGPNRNVDYFDPNFKPAYTNNWSLDVQRELPGSFVATVGYVGAVSSRLRSDLDRPNALDPRFLGLGWDLLNSRVDSPAAQAAGIREPYPGFIEQFGDDAKIYQALKPFPQYNFVNTNLESSGHSTYHSLQTKLEKRFSEGLSLIASYTWSKTITDAASNLGFAGGVLQNAFDRRSQKAVADQDIPHTLVVSYIYELPIGRGKRFLNQEGVVNQLVGGWQIGGVHRYQSGEPLVLSTSNNDDFLGLFSIGGSLRPNIDPTKPFELQTGRYDPGPDVNSPNRRLNPAAFPEPPGYTTAQPGVNPNIFFGSAPRTLDYLRQYPFYNEDFNILKRFRFSETVNLEFRTEIFNAFNRVRFGAPDTNTSSANFGRIFGTGNAPRRIQFGFKFNF